MRRVFRSANPLLIVLSVWLVGCGHWKQPVDPAAFLIPGSCPDFSGVYRYAGPEEAPEVCDVTTSSKVVPVERLMLPVFDTSDLGGGFVPVIVPSKIEIWQPDCRVLHFGAGQSHLKPLSERPPGPPQPASFESRWREWNLSLVPEIQGTEIQWSENSLFFNTRFLAGGFGAGWGIERMKFSLEHTDDGSLVVEFRLEKGASGNVFLASRCELPKVE